MERKLGRVVNHPYYDGEWTFYYYENGQIIYDDAMARSYTTRDAAYRAMQRECAVT